MRLFALTAVAFLAALPAQALTVVSMAAGDELRYTLSDVSNTTLDFALPAGTTGYANFGGYIKWSTLENGRMDGEGSYESCMECGYSGGSWDLATTADTAETVSVDFGDTLDTVYVWVKASYGAGTLSYGDSTSTSDTGTDPMVSAVPLPGAGLLLLGALGFLGFRRRA